MRLTVTFDGETLAFDDSLIDMATAMTICDYTGKGLLSWERGWRDGDARCLQALLFAIWAQNGRRVGSPSDVRVPPVQLYVALTEALIAEIERLSKEAAAEPDPTVTVDDGTST